MRFTLESERVIQYLKGRGFKVCDVKKSGRPLPILKAPKKWAGIMVPARDASGEIVTTTVVGADGTAYTQPVLIEKTKAIVQRAMQTPTLGLSNNIQDADFELKIEPLPSAKPKVELKLLPNREEAKGDPLSEAWEGFEFKESPKSKPKFETVQTFVLGADLEKSGWMDVTKINQRELRFIR